MKLNELDGIGQAELLRSGSASAGELVQEAISRAKDLNPKLNAIVIETFEHAIDEAKRVDAMAPEDRGPLAGVPFLIKDNNVYQKGIPTTFSCRFLENNIRETESEIVETWSSIGLLSIGKTNTPEFAASYSTEPLMRGPTLNPWNVNRTPGGSSGGSAAAVAAGIVPFAHANDAGGSIRVPAAACGLFGLKPSRGRVSLAPYDTNGWMGVNQEHVVSRSVRDSELMLRMHASGGPSLQRSLWSSGDRLRVAVGKHSLVGVEASGEILSAVDDCARLLERMGAEIVECELPTSLAEHLSHFSSVIWPSIQRLVDEVQVLSGRALDDELFEPTTRRMLKSVDQQSAMQIANATSALDKASFVMKRFFSEFDVFLTPTLPFDPPKIGELKPAVDDEDIELSSQKIMSFGAFTVPFNCSGNPAMSVPFGLSKAGMPIGVQLAAAQWNEPLLFELAKEIEKRQPWQLTANAN